MNETLTMRKNAGDDDAARSALTGALIGLARVAEGLEDMPYEATQAVTQRPPGR